jgi:N-acetylmuramoyl-L-alanine amidase
MTLTLANPVNRAFFAVLSLGLFLTSTGCQSTLIRHHVAAKSQDSRVQFIVIHATEETFDRSLKILTTGDVSSHYLVNRNPADIWQLVDEQQRAWHAGPSSWQGRTSLNSASIGIEIVSTEHVGVSEEPFTDAQIDQVIKLIKDIQTRHHVRADRIVGHGEVQPDHKTDPGRLFPWRRLADAGLIPWPDASLVLKTEGGLGDLPTAAWWQARLAMAGYDCPVTGVFDTHTLKTIQVFRDKYDPERAQLPIDRHAVAILTVITNPNGLVMKRADGSWDVFKPE